jgi:hypothetical protein
LALRLLFINLGVFDIRPSFKKYIPLAVFTALSLSACSTEPPTQDKAKALVVDLDKGETRTFTEYDFYSGNCSVTITGRGSRQANQETCFSGLAEKKNKNSQTVDAFIVDMCVPSSHVNGSTPQP